MRNILHQNSIGRPAIDLLSHSRKVGKAKVASHPMHHYFCCCHTALCRTWRPDMHFVSSLDKRLRQQIRVVAHSARLGRVLACDDRPFQIGIRMTIEVVTLYLESLPDLPVGASRKFMPTLLKVERWAQATLERHILNIES